MRRRAGAWLVLALLAALCLSGCAGGDGADTGTVYHLYFGLNDRDTGSQEVTLEEASAYIRGVIEDRGCGYTEFRAYGAYTENGASKGNDTLVYMLAFVAEEDVEAIAEQAAEHLNLASVLCRKGETLYTFYAGGEKQP